MKKNLAKVKCATKECAVSSKTLRPELVVAASAAAPPIKNQKLLTTIKKND